MNTPRTLVTELRRGHVIPLVGSGVSLSVQPGLFPTWPELLQKLADRLLDEDKRDSADIVRLFCKSGRLLKAAEEALSALGKAEFHDVMRGCFDVERPADADLSLPRAIWDLRPPLVVTTNYDDVLQWANPQARRLLNHQQAELGHLFRSASAERPTVWHLHGHFSQADSLVLAPLQYDALYEESRQGQSDYEAALRQLENAAANRTFLFVGFGLNDEYVMNLLRGVLAAFGGALPPSFALLKHGEADTAALWESHNVQVLEFEDFGPPQCRVLEELATDSQSEPSAAGPATAAQQQKSPAPTLPAAYLEWLRGQCAGIELPGLRDEKGRAVQLHQVYVPLTTTGVGDRSGPEGEPGAAADERSLARTMRGEREQKPQLLLDLLATESLYVAGAAGSGKSTFCRWLAWLVCSGRLPEKRLAAEEGYAESFPEPLRDFLPLLVPLRDFWSVMPIDPGKQSMSPSELTQTLGRWVQGRRPGDLTWPCVEGHLDHGSLLLILDGLDEVPVSHGEQNRLCHPRAMLLAGLVQSLAAWTGPGSRVLLTSRPYGVSEAQTGKLGLRPAAISDLDDSLQRLLVNRWFEVLSGHSADGRRLAQQLLNQLAERTEVAPLAANPMLLTAMCVIFNQGKRLPRDKHDLYDRILDNVLHNRYVDERQEIPLIRNRLSVIAYGMHTGAGLDEPRSTPQAEATYGEIEQIIQRYRDESPATERGYRGSMETRDDLLTRSGVLLPKGDKRAGFYHFTFQDFLAAQLILEREPDLAAFFRQRSATEEWRHTLSFVFSSLMARNTLPDKGINLLEDLIDPLTLDSPGLAVVVADCLEILSGHSFGLRNEHVQQFTKLCLEAIEREVPVQPRFDLALALGRLGDPRVPVDLRNHDDERAWVVVPAGEYPIGLEPPKDDSWFKHYPPLPPETFKIEQPFRISRYPVTDAKFALFLDDGGYQAQSWWSGEGWAWQEKEKAETPAQWRDGRFNGANQPVVGVSFWEAEAFAAWADCRLLSERQWEAAARGPEGLIYPWGNEWQEGICNTAELQLKRTSPVGMFPPSRSVPFGLEDIAGNVCEWCADQRGSDDPVGRVVRGGAWLDHQDYARCVIRYGGQPGLRFNFVGFRVCCISSPGLA